MWSRCINPDCDVGGQLDRHWSPDPSADPVVLICLKCKSRQSISDEVLAHKVVQAYIDQQTRRKTHTFLPDPIAYA